MPWPAIGSVSCSTSPPGARAAGSRSAASLDLWPLLAIAAGMTDSARAIDGDTLELSDGRRIRLWGIDAVEGSQVCQRVGTAWRCGDDATAALRRLVDGRELTCDARDRDRYGRIVAVCRVGRPGHRRRAGAGRLGARLPALQRRRLCDRAGDGQGRASGPVGGEFVPP
jgi:endonuclease YncB( thermonuclease family)